jgi:hypothetical protein
MERKSRLIKPNTAEIGGLLKDLESSFNESRSAAVMRWKAHADSEARIY